MYELYDKNIGTNPSEDSTSGGYICSDCGAWVLNGAYCNCHYYPDKIEMVCKILKVLVGEGIIKEPISFKESYDLVMKLAKGI